MINSISPWTPDCQAMLRASIVSTRARGLLLEHAVLAARPMKQMRLFSETRARQAPSQEELSGENRQRRFKERGDHSEYIGSESG